MCYPWQNKVISSTDNARTTVDLDGNEIHVYAQSETTYGEPAGLFGINCKHYPTPFIPGVSIIRGTPQDEEANAKTYAESQQQRALERRLREEKRDLLMMKAQGAPEEMIEAQRARVRSASADIADFCDETGRARHRDREGVYTERRFPAADTYDVTEFENKQREMIQGFYSVGGAQVEYNNVPGMVPNVPLMPKATPVVGTVPTDTPDMKYGKPFDYENKGYRRPQQEQFANAKATLDGAPENVRALWAQCADDFEYPSFGAPGDSSAYYSRWDRRTHFASYKEAFVDSGYQRNNACWFHEYGHNIDNILGGGGNNYLSLNYVSKDGKMFVQVLEEEVGNVIGKWYLKENGLDLYDAVKTIQNGPGGMGFGSYTRQMLKAVMPADEWRAMRDIIYDAGDDDSVLRPLVSKWLTPHFERELRASILSRAHTEVAEGFCTWVKARHTIYEVSDVSDIFGNVMTRSYGSKYAYPFGVGHKYDYQMNASNMPKEAFAEMYSATVTQSDALDGIKKFLPNSYAFFIDMIEGATK